MVKTALSFGTDSRKVAVFTVIWAAATALLWFGKIDPANWLALSQWGFAALAAGLTAEHFAGRVGPS